MSYKRCPRCEQNYIKEEEELCEVCKKELQPGDEEQNFMKNVKRDEVIVAGKEFPLSKHHQLINYLTGSDKKKYLKSTYPLTKSCYIWFVYLDGVAREGWRDIVLQDGRIQERYVGNKAKLPSNFGLTFNYLYRAVFEKTGGSFIFRGVYKIDTEKSTPYERYYTKVSDTTTLYDF